MKIKLIRNCLITLGLLLFFVVSTPTATAQAQSGTGKKSDDYQLSLTNVTLAKGQTRTLKVYNLGEKARIDFKSGDKEIASVNDDGEISANNVGDTVITAIIKKGSDTTSLHCNVTVGAAAVSVKFPHSIIVMGVDSTDLLDVILKPSNTVEDAKFASLNSSVASVTPGGRVTAKSYGFAEVRAYIDATESNGSQKYDSCAVIVTDKDNVAKLDKYLSDKSELDGISDNDLLNALDRFFNKEFDQSSSSNLISSLNRYLNNVFDLK